MPTQPALCLATMCMRVQLQALIMVAKFHTLIIAQALPKMAKARRKKALAVAHWAPQPLIQAVQSLRLAQIKPLGKLSSMAKQQPAFWKRLTLRKNIMTVQKRVYILFGQKMQKVFLHLSQMVSGMAQAHGHSVVKARKATHILSPKKMTFIILRFM